MSTQTTLFSPVAVDTAPEGSRPLLQKIQKSFKFIPNLFGVFANSPILLEGYLGLEGVFDKGTLECGGAPDHPTGRKRGKQLQVLHRGSQHVAEGLLARAGRRRLRRQVQPAAYRPEVERACRAHERDRAKRGYVAAQTIQNFLDAGYRKDQILEVLMGVALKTISNYTDHISPTELDQAVSIRE